MRSFLEHIVFHFFVYLALRPISNICCQFLGNLAHQVLNIWVMQLQMHLMFWFASFNLLLATVVAARITGRLGSLETVTHRIRSFLGLKLQRLKSLACTVSDEQGTHGCHWRYKFSRSFADSPILCIFVRILKEYCSLTLYIFCVFVHKFIKYDFLF